MNFLIIAWLWCVVRYATTFFCKCPSGVGAFAYVTLITHQRFLLKRKQTGNLFLFRRKLFHKISFWEGKIESYPMHEQPNDTTKVEKMYDCEQ